MGWHVLSSTYFDFDRFARESRADTLPHHLLPSIAERLGATIHQPPPAADYTPDRWERLGGRLYGGPQHWAQARRVLAQLADGDAVYSVGCDAGVPLALLCAVHRRRVSFAIAFADVARVRSAFFGWLLALLRVRLRAFVTTDHQARLVERSFGRLIDGVHVIEGQTDCRFFRPPEARPVNDPPLVASCGVERRDYQTLASGLDGLDVGAEVCFASPNRTARTRYTMPEPVPANMDFRHFEFPDLRSLYQRADVVVLPLLENRYSAGLTSLFEAIACGAPVVVTESPGIIQGLIDGGHVLGVPAGQPDALRRAVQAVLDDPAAAAARADGARAVVVERYSAASFLDRLESVLLDRPPAVPST